jgi:hypothetical protein
MKCENSKFDNKEKVFCSIFKEKGKVKNTVITDNVAAPNVYSPKKMSKEMTNKTRKYY